MSTPPLRPVPASVTDSVTASVLGLGPGLDDLQSRWSGRAQFVILDLAFGLGEKFLAIRRAWQGDPQRPGRLFYLAPGLDLSGADALAPQLRAIWPSATPGLHRILLDSGCVTFDLMFGEAEHCLEQMEAQADVVYLSAGLSQKSAKLLTRLVAPDIKLGATLAQAQVLTSAGFLCHPAPAPASASCHVQASLRTRRWQRITSRVAPDKHAIVIGAGLAGAAACERLAARGWRLTLIERQAQPAQEASGNLAGIFMPLVSQDDNPATRLARAAYLFALRHWQHLGGVGTAFAGARCGVLQLARSPLHAEVQRRIAQAWRYPSSYARWLESSAASAMLGSMAPDGAWFFEQGGWAHPGTVCETMLEACGKQLERRFSNEVLALVRKDAQWQVLGANGVVIAEAATVILANGVEATSIAQAASLPLLAVRGQVTHLGSGTFPALPMVVCREAYMTPASRDGIVSVGASYDADADVRLQAHSQQANLQTMSAMLGVPMPQDLPLAGRVGFRCVAPDRLPLVGALPMDTLNTLDTLAGPIERLRDVARWPGLYGLLGYASRGLIWAPLAAELLAAQLCGEPLPLESKLAAALDPGRFLLKAGRRAPQIALFR